MCHWIDLCTRQYRNPAGLVRIFIYNIMCSCIMKGLTIIRFRPDVERLIWRHGATHTRQPFPIKISAIGFIIRIWLCVEKWISRHTFVYHVQKTHQHLFKLNYSPTLIYVQPAHVTQNRNYQYRLRLLVWKPVQIFR